MPQGTILGPLLFTIFVNNLPRVVDHCSVNLYADDTTIHCSAKALSDVRDQLSSDLSHVAEWIEANGLKINVSKTQLLVLSPPRRQEQAKTITIHLKGEEIVQHETAKYLGVIVDNKLTWKPHILNLRRKCLAGQIERIQNYAMRIILRKSPRTGSEPLRQQLSLTSLKTRRQIATLLQVQRCLHKCAPSYLTSKFISNSNFGYSSTRGASKLHLKRPATSYYGSSFEFQGALMFNTLPAEIRQLETKTSFTRALLKHSQVNNR